MEAEIAETSAKERAFAAMTTPFLPQLQPVKLEPSFNDQDSAVSSLASWIIQEEAPYSEQGDPVNSVLRGPSGFSATTAGEDLRRETIELQRQQNALHLQQNRIVELLVLNQNRSKLPQSHVPVSDGNPIEFHTFIQAFESLIESRTSCSTDRLYYLEQFTLGDVKELVRSCHHLPLGEKYNETCRLLRKKFGDEYRIAFADETEALE